MITLGRSFRNPLLVHSVALKPYLTLERPPRGKNDWWLICTNREAVGVESDHIVIRH